VWLYLLDNPVAKRTKIAKDIGVCERTVSNAKKEIELYLRNKGEQK